MGTTDLFLGGQAAGAWMWPKLPCSAVFKMHGDFPSLPRTSFLPYFTLLYFTPACRVIRNVGILHQYTVSQSRECSSPWDPVSHRALEY